MTFHDIFDNKLSFFVLYGQTRITEYWVERKIGLDQQYARIFSGGIS